MIISNTSLSGNYIQIPFSNSIPDFLTVKAFTVRINHPNLPLINEVISKPSILFWIKSNLDGGALGTCVKIQRMIENHQKFAAQKDL